MEVEVEIHPQPDGECSPENKSSTVNIGQTAAEATQLLQEQPEGDSRKAESQESTFSIDIEQRESEEAIIKEGTNTVLNHSSSLPNAMYYNYYVVSPKKTLNH